MVSIPRDLGVLSPNEEERLFVEGRAGCASSRERLVFSYTGFVKWAAKRYSWGKLPFDDAVQEGWVAVLLAIRDFDLDRGPRLNFLVVRRVTWRLKTIKKHLGYMPRDFGDFDGNEVIREDFDLLERLADGEYLEKLDEAMATLGRWEMAVMAMKIGFGCDPMRDEDIAYYVGVSTTQVQNLRVSALKKLREQLGIQVGD